MSEIHPALLHTLDQIGTSVRRRRIGYGVVLMLAGAAAILVGFVRAVEDGGLDAISWIIGASLVAGILLPQGAKVVDQVADPIPRLRLPGAGSD